LGAIDPAPPAPRRDLWFRVLRLTLFGGVLILLISIPGLANEDQTASPGLLSYAGLVLVFAGIAARTYLIARRFGVARSHAVLIALGALPVSFGLALLLVWGIVSTS
jgi:hypothetical protein